MVWWGVVRWGGVWRGRRLDDGVLLALADEDG